MLLSLSENSVIFEALDLVIILSEWLPDIVRVWCVLSGAFFLSACISLSQDLSASDLVLSDHFDGEDVIDLDVMGRDAVMKEVWWEHHVVTRVPELGLILLIEGENVARSDEAESTQDHVGAEEPNEKARIIKWSVWYSDKPRKDVTLNGHVLVNRNPEEVADFKESECRVVSIFTLSNPECLEKVSDATWSWRKSLIDNVLEALRVSKQPALESSCHYLRLL